MQFLHLCLKYEIGYINRGSCWRVQLVRNTDRFNSKPQQLLQSLQQLHQIHVADQHALARRTGVYAHNQSNSSRHEDKTLILPLDTELHVVV